MVPSTPSAQGQGDASGHIVEAIAQAHVDGRRIRVCGSGSKRDWLHTSERADLLSMTEHYGVVAYDPAELVVTARAGTELRELNRLLHHENQCLAFDPPDFYGSGTVGGMVACGLSGPSRPWGGAVRDAVLGVDMVNGLGERLSFGGQVMKNVAGYDVSRLMAGSWGGLGALLAVSLRVQPLTPHVMTLVMAASAQESLELCVDFGRRSLPINGTWWFDNKLYVRLAGSETSLREAAQEIGGEVLAASGAWDEVRNHQHEYFKAREGAVLWRVIVPPAAALPDADPESLSMEWRGGLRWLWHDDARWVSSYARAQGGWAWARGMSQPIAGAQHQLMAQIKHSFDPGEVFLAGLEGVAV